MYSTLRCFKDDAVMVEVEGHPGWIRCTLCGFTTQIIGYNAESVRRDFSGIDPEVAEVWEDEQSYKATVAKKRAGGGPKGRKTKSGRKALPDPDADDRAVIRHNARTAGTSDRVVVTGWLGVGDGFPLWRTLRDALAGDADYKPERLDRHIGVLRGRRVRVTIELLDSEKGVDRIVGA